MSINNMGQPVVVDSNIIIKEMQEGRSLHPIAKRIKKHKSKMVIPESVLGEVQKVTGNETDIIMDTIYEFCKHPITMDKTEEINAESERLVEQYELWPNMGMLSIDLDPNNANLPGMNWWWDKRKHGYRKTKE